MSGARTRDGWNRAWVRAGIVSSAAGTLMLIVGGGWTFLGIFCVLWPLKCAAMILMNPYPRAALDRSSQPTTPGGTDGL